MYRRVATERGIGTVEFVVFGRLSFLFQRKTIQIMIVTEDCSRSQFFLLPACLLVSVHGGVLCWCGIGAVHCMVQKKRTWSLDQQFLLDMFPVMEYRLIGQKRVTKHETMKLFKSSTPNPTLCFIKRRTSVPVTSRQLSIVQRAILYP